MCSAVCSFSLSLRLIHHFVPFKLNEEKYEKSTQFTHFYSSPSFPFPFFSLFVPFLFTSFQQNGTKGEERRERKEE